MVQTTDKSAGAAAQDCIGLLLKDSSCWRGRMVSPPAGSKRKDFPGLMSSSIERTTLGQKIQKKESTTLGGFQMWKSRIFISFIALAMLVGCTQIPITATGKEAILS